MKVILTGITGNLGYEVAQELVHRGVEVIPCVRAGKDFHAREKFPRIIECDLLKNDIEFSGQVDGIIHCAGVVHFKDAGQQNERMMERVVKYAKGANVPVFHASTAFIYRPDNDGALIFNNAYESDKYRAEERLLQSGVPHAILRPSVLTGHSRTGSIRNFSGFYLIARAFAVAAEAARLEGRMLRFPRMLGQSDLIPVDQAARSVADTMMENRLGTFYVTNPEPLSSAWVLEETLDFFNVRDNVKMEDVSFAAFATMDLTQEETWLYRFSEHFNPYWSMQYSFPGSICTENLVNHDYMKRALAFFQDSGNFHAKNTR